MKLNKYLKELGLNEYDLPGYYNEQLENNEETVDVAGADIRNKEDEEGFCEYEFFNLDRTLSLYIYSKLCYFKEHIADIATPGCLCSFDTTGMTQEEREESQKQAHDKWMSILDKMILAFKLQIVGTTDGREGLDYADIREGMHLFVDYYSCLWF